MLFNSFEFLYFLVVVIILFGVAGKYRWAVLLLASYCFYASWRWQYTFLIVGSTVVDYFCALRIGASNNAHTKRGFLALSLLSNLSLLFFFKYAAFFGGTVLPEINDAWSFEVNVLLPVGISFYTFQTLSYTIDVYRGTISPEKHLGRFALFVTYFPQLVAGPIERASSMLSQLREKLKFDIDNVLPAFKLILWGLFKKVVIADRLASLVDPVYNQSDSYGGVVTIIATVAFAFQIYCDFSGYSDMAIGISRLFNVRLTTNFDRPYLAVNLTDFWRRWHITLSSWFKDYLYIPLGGSRVSRNRLYVNIMITFIVSGIWHGANYTFVIWGAIHGFFLIVDRIVPSILKFRPLQVIVTFSVVCVGWVFFRASTVQDALQILNSWIHINLGFANIKHELLSTGVSKLNLIVSIVALGLLFLKEQQILRPPAVTNVLFYLAVMFMIIIFGINDSDSFIYFQF